MQQCPVAWRQLCLCRKSDGAAYRERHYVVQLKTVADWMHPPERSKRLDRWGRFTSSSALCREWRCVQCLHGRAHAHHGQVVQAIWVRHAGFCVSGTNPS